MYFTGLLAFLVTVIYGHAAYFDNYDYCKLPCDNGIEKTIHVKCERKDCGPDKSNCKEFEAVEMTDELKQSILDEHNKLRNKVASGEEKQGENGPQPEASNMMALKYHDELGSVAQCVANTCEVKHSKCHRAKKLPWAGQNIGYRSSSSKSIYDDIESVIKEIINNFYDEVKYFNKDHIKSFISNQRSGHYTAMVWGDLQGIGCGIAKYKDDKGYAVILVCNYGSKKPAANLVNGEMYKVGKPCSACPKGKECNSKYNALCGEDTLDLREADGKNKTDKACIKN